MRILGIETSCDETGIAIFDDDGLTWMALETKIRFGDTTCPDASCRLHISRLAQQIRFVDTAYSGLVPETRPSPGPAPAQEERRRP